jgi:CTP:molybdopterin cytidylyltransferase MocA
MAALEGDVGAKLLIERYREAIGVVEVADDGILFDVDTVEDLAAARGR